MLGRRNIKETYRANRLQKRYVYSTNFSIILRCQTWLLELRIKNNSVGVNHVKQKYQTRLGKKKDVEGILYKIHFTIIICPGAARSALKLVKFGKYESAKRKSH